MPFAPSSSKRFSPYDHKESSVAKTVALVEIPSCYHPPTTLA